MKQLWAKHICHVQISSDICLSHRCVELAILYKKMEVVLLVQLDSEKL